MCIRDSDSHDQNDKSNRCHTFYDCDDWYFSIWHVSMSLEFHWQLSNWVRLLTNWVCSFFSILPITNMNHRTYSVTFTTNIERDIKIFWTMNRGAVSQWKIVKEEKGCGYQANNFSLGNGSPIHGSKIWMPHSMSVAKLTEYVHYLIGCDLKVTVSA